MSKVLSVLRGANMSASASHQYAEPCLGSIRYLMKCWSYADMSKFYTPPATLARGNYQRERLFIQRASPALFRARNLLFRKIELTHYDVA